MIDSLSGHLYTNVMICKLQKFGGHFTPEVIETSDAAAEEANQSQEVVTDQDRKRKLTAGWWSEKFYRSQRKRTFEL